MILDIDVGNTRVKWRLCGASEVKQGWYLRVEPPGLPETKPGAIRVSSVAGEDFENELTATLLSRWGVAPWFARSQAQAMGLTNSYEDPTRMGVDRWLAMLAAWVEIRGPVCVVDAGSALTIDLVSGDGLHRGGYIIPGRSTMQNSLLTGTDRVRFDRESSATLDPGTSTAAAVGNGALLAAVAAIELALSRAALPGRDLVTLVSGGDGQAIASLLNSDARFVPNLVFDGLALAAGS